MEAFLGHDLERRHKTASSDSDATPPRDANERCRSRACTKQRNKEDEWGERGYASPLEDEQGAAGRRGTNDPRSVSPKRDEAPTQLASSTPASKPSQNKRHVNAIMNEPRFSSVATMVISLKTAR